MRRGCGHDLPTAPRSVYQQGGGVLACQHAIADCHQTLRDFGAGIDKAYETKLWAEIDAMRERLAALQR
jgi:hypothetical protein